MGQQVAQQDCHQRVDIGISGNQGRRRNPQQPGIGSETYQRAENDQVAQAQQRAGRNRPQVDPPPFPAQRAQQQQAGSAHQHLHTGTQQRRGRQPGAAAVERTGRPRESSHGQHQRPQRINFPGQTAQAGRADQQADAQKSEYYPRCRQPAAALVRRSPSQVSLTRPQRVQQHHPQRYRAHQQRCHTRIDELFRPHDAPVAAHQQQHPHDGSRAPFHPLRGSIPAQAAKGIQDGPGDQETGRGHQEGRQGLDGKTDSQVSRPPHDINRQHGSPNGQAAGLRIRHERPPSPTGPSCGVPPPGNYRTRPSCG